MNIKNEHIIYAYGQKPDNSYILIIGITEIGIEFKKNIDGNYLDIESPGKEYNNISYSVVIYTKTKQDFKDLLQKLKISIVTHQ